MGSNKTKNMEIAAKHNKVKTINVFEGAEKL